MDDSPPLPPLVRSAHALAHQLGFPLTRQEAQGSGWPHPRSDAEGPQARADGVAQAHHDGRPEPGGWRPDPDVPSASLPGVGRFLAVLAAGCHGGRIGEIGTGVGVGSAWMTEAMPADCTLVTVEIDARRAAAAAQLLASDRRVRVLKGDAWELLPACGPFDLLFSDAGWRDSADLSQLVDLLKIGGRVVMDDVTPLRAAPAQPALRAAPAQPALRAAPAQPAPGAAPAQPGTRERDVKREFFFGDRRLLSTEVVLPDLCNSLLVGTRIA